MVRNRTLLIIVARQRQSQLSQLVLNLFQTLAAMSGNSTLQTMGDLSKNYDGVRIGLDTHK